MVNISTLERLDCSLSAEISHQLNARKDEFQMMPDAAAEALQLVKDPSCNIGVVAETIERDVKLAASILAIANSVIYSPGRPIAIVREAIIHVGFRQCQNLIHACCAKSLMDTVKIEPASKRDALLQHSLTTGAIAVELNQRLRLGFQGEEFTAGLLHDIGRLLLGVLYPDKFPELDAIQSQESPESLEEESEIVGTDHAVVGCSFAIANRLPDQLAEAVRFHHQPERATFDPKLTATIAVADDIANHLISTESSECYDLSQNPGLPVLEQAAGAEAADELARSLTALFDVGTNSASFSPAMT